MQYRNTNNGRNLYKTYEMKYSKILLGVVINVLTDVKRQKRINKLQY